MASFYTGWIRLDQFWGIGNASDTLKQECNGGLKALLEESVRITVNIDRNIIDCFDVN